MNTRLWFSTVGAITILVGATAAQAATLALFITTMKVGHPRVGPTNLSMTVATMELCYRRLGEIVTSRRQQGAIVSGSQDAPGGYRFRYTEPDGKEVEEIAKCLE